MRRSWLLATIALIVATACQGDGEAVRPAAPTTASTSAALTAPTLTSRPEAGLGTVTLTVTDLRLVNSEESDNGFRIFFDAAAQTGEVSVALTGGVPSPNRTILVCPAVELENRVQAPGCATPAAGEAVKVPHLPHYRGIEVIQVGVTSSGPSANSTAIAEIAVTFPAASREVRMRLPAVATGDAGGRPAFRLTPAGPGTYRATARWTPIGANSGEAELVLSTAASTVGRAQGGPGTTLSGNLSPAGEATLRFRNTGPTAILGTVLTALFP